jgi:hypothetical protein
MKKVFGYLALIVSGIIFIGLFSLSITIVKEIFKVAATGFKTEQIAYTTTLT